MSHEESSSPPPASAPAPDATHWESLHPRARIGLRATALAAILPAMVPTLVVLVAWDSARLSFLAKLGVFLLVMGVLATIAWRYADRRHAHTRFALDEAGLRIRRGVLWHSETLIPRSRVQHIDLNRGPLDRRFGLATLKVFTAGTRLASVGLDGLPAERAVELRDALVVTDDDLV